MADSSSLPMQILAVISGEYGQRHVDNIAAHGPEDWSIAVWEAPPILPPIVDYPEDYVPGTLESADLILALGEHKGVAELIPELARVSGARSVIAPVDHEEWLPRGLARQLRGWLSDMGVSSVTPKPFCSLAESEYNVRIHRQTYDDPTIAAFARWFGRPKLDIAVDRRSRRIISANVVRDACCGCARYVAEKLPGTSADDAELEAGLAHHHYPCLASMVKDVDFNDTLMHVSGNILKDEVGEGVRAFKQVIYIMPGQMSEQ